MFKQKTKMKGLMVAFITCFCLQGLSQTKPMFSEYMFNMLELNPAYAGNRDNTNVSAVYRRQWVGIPGSPTTWMASIDGRLTSNNSMSYGVQLYNDQLGIEKSTGMQGFYAVHLPLSYGNYGDIGHESGTTLSLGLSFGAMNYKADFTQVNLITNPDPAFMKLVSGFTPTVGCGFLLHSYKWYIGASAPALLRSKINNENHADVSSLLSYNELFATAGYIFGREYSAIKVKPSILLKTAPGAPFEYDFNLNAWFNNIFMAGVSYRTGDAVVGMIDLQAAKGLRIGYAYDFTTTQLNQYSRGTHELMLRYEFGSKSATGTEQIRYY